MKQQSRLMKQYRLKPLDQVVVGEVGVLQEPGKNDVEAHPGLAAVMLDHEGLGSILDLLFEKKFRVICQNKRRGCEEERVLRQTKEVARYFPL